jgi:diadenosine tetraphosphate (Ap4A) HIT family hydrolase
MDNLSVFENAHWKVSHRRDARYDGYLVISSTRTASDLGDLDDDALSSLGPVMKTVERLLQKTYHPHKVIFYKLGFSPGFNLHFHAAPVSESLLAEISRHRDYSTEPDGNDVIMFLSREYCERPLTDTELEKQRLAVSVLKANLPVV